MSAGHCWWSRSKFWSVTLVYHQVLLTTHWWNNLETWAWPHCKCAMLALSRSIEWYVTWPTSVNMWPHVTLTRGKMLTFQNNHVYVLTRLNERSTMVPMVSLAFLVQKLSAKKKTFLSKTIILTFSDVKRLNRWCWSMSFWRAFERTFPSLVTTSRSRVRGRESQQHPLPPHQVLGNPESRQRAGTCHFFNTGC